LEINPILASEPLNPKYDDVVVTEEVQIIGRVIRKIKRY
jgi:hypothetical protein